MNSKESEFGNQEKDHVRRIAEEQLKRGVEEISTDNQRINQQVEMHVMSDGSDNNDGLTPEEGKATIIGAIREAYQSNYDGHLIINLENGATFNERVDLRNIGHPNITIKGSTDNNGDPDTVIDGNGFATCLEVDGSIVRIEDVKLLNADDRGVRCWWGKLELKNTVVKDAKTHQGQLNGGKLTMDQDSVLDQTGVTGDRANLNCLMGSFNLSGTIKGDGSGDMVVRIKEHAGGLIDGTIQGEGDGTTTWAIRTFHQGGLKFFGSASDATVIAQSEQKGWVRAQNYNISNYSIPFKAVGPGYVYDVDNDKYHGTPAPDFGSTRPSFSGGAQDGNFGRVCKHYDWWVNGNWYSAGVSEMADPAPADLRTGQRVHDTLNGRILYKDQNGTVHYTTWDGTLK